MKDAKDAKRCESCYYRKIHDGDYPAWCYLFEEFMPGCKKYREAKQ